MAEPSGPCGRRPRLDGPAIALVMLLCGLWGVQQVAVKLAIAGGLPPLMQAAARSAGAALLLVGWVRLREGRAGMAAVLRFGRTWRPEALLAGLFAIEVLALFPGLRLTTASRGVVFLYTAPFFTAIGAHLLLRERLRPRQALGLVAAFTGVGIAFGQGIVAGGGSLAGDALCLAAAAAWSSTTLLIRATPTLARATASRLLLVQLGGSAPLLFAASVMLGELRSWPAPSAIAWAGLFYQTAIVAFASYLAWFWMVQRYPVGRLSAFTFLTPLFGILAGAALLGEQVGLAVLAGLAAIAGGLWLLNGESARQAG